MFIFPGRVVIALALIAVLSDASLAAIAGLERVATGLNLPTFVTHAPGDSSRLFVAEKLGIIKIVDLATNSVSGTFLNIPDATQSTTDEGGLLGLAFHPNYFNVGETGYGKFYVYATVSNSVGGSPFSSHIREYSVLGDPATSNVADLSSEREILSVVQPASNHNGGWIGFNPQVTPGQPRYLHVALGDGGGSNDNGTGHTAGVGNAQDITDNLLGKMLRIDVNGDDFPADANRNYAIPATNPFVDATGDDEIWAYGLRNPYRDSFDRLTGDLWIGDVGQGAREEINFQAADSEGGANYGWRLREGNIQTPGTGIGGPEPADYVPPVYDYLHGGGQFQGNAINGGYVYRGPDPDLQDLYFFSDSQVHNVWTYDPSIPQDPVANIDAELGALYSSVNVMVSFGEDAVGNLYIVDYTTGGFPPAQNVGEIYRIVTNSVVAGDYNRDGRVDEQDYGQWKSTFGATGDGLAADGNGDGTVDAADYTVWRDNLGTSVHDLGAGSGSLLVPEPAAATLLSLAAISTLIHRRRQVTMDPSHTSQS